MREDGGPAFPVPALEGVAAAQARMFGYPEAYPGMSLRDYFAANVGSNDLAGINEQPDREALAGRPEPEDAPSGVDAINFNLEVEAALRYLYADAMLKARAK